MKIDGVTAAGMIIALAVPAKALITADQMSAGAMAFVSQMDSALMAIVGPVAFLVLVAMGAKYIAARDDENERAEAKERIKQVFVGLVLIIAGRAIVGLFT